MKTCKLCLKEIIEPKQGQIYHPECFKLNRKEYQKLWWVKKRKMRYNVDVLKREVDEIKETLKKEIKEELKNETI